MTREPALLVVALATFFGYYSVPVEHRPWVYYVMTGVCMITLAANLLPRMRTKEGSLACAFVIIEAGQQSICGLVLFGVKSGKDLCSRLAWYDDLHAAAASLAVAALIVWSLGDG